MRLLTVRSPPEVAADVAGNVRDFVGFFLAKAHREADKRRRCREGDEEADSLSRLEAGENH